MLQNIEWQFNPPPIIVDFNPFLGACAPKFWLINFFVHFQTFFSVVLMGVLKRGPFMCGMFKPLINLQIYYCSVRVMVMSNSALLFCYLISAFGHRPTSTGPGLFLGQTELYYYIIGLL